jgi:hypothetical protein
MDAGQSLRVLFHLTSIQDTIRIASTSGAGEGTAAQHKPVFLWTVFFKIDGDTTVVNESLRLEGTATVVGTPGNHGDLGKTNSVTPPGVTVTIPIPAQLGQFGTVLKPIPLNKPIANVQSVPGAVGCVALLIEEGDIPADAVAKGHDALNSTLQIQLNQIITTLGITKQQPTPDDISAMTQAVSDAVESAIKNSLSSWQKIVAVVLGADEMLGHSLFEFMGDKLAQAPPSGIVLHDLYQSGGAGSASDPSGTVIDDVSITQDYDLNGVLFCDPLNSSLTRFLQSQSLPLDRGIRSLMQPQFASVKTWMASVPW